MLKRNNLIFKLISKISINLLKRTKVNFRLQRIIRALNTERMLFSCSFSLYVLKSGIQLSLFRWIYLQSLVCNLNLLEMSEKYSSLRPTNQKNLPSRVEFSCLFSDSLVLNFLLLERSAKESCPKLRMIVWPTFCRWWKRKDQQRWSFSIGVDLVVLFYFLIFHLLLTRSTVHKIVDGEWYEWPKIQV